jgi:hypothetical protein
MLPIRWILPAGGVLLAIAVLVLVFAAPDGLRSQMPNTASVRSALLSSGVSVRNGGSLSFLVQSSDALMN